MCCLRVWAVVTIVMLPVVPTCQRRQLFWTSLPKNPLGCLPNLLEVWSCPAFRSLLFRMYVLLFADSDLCVDIAPLSKLIDGFMVRSPTDCHVGFAQLASVSVLIAEATLVLSEAVSHSFRVPR